MKVRARARLPKQMRSPAVPLKQFYDAETTRSEPACSPTFSSPAVWPRAATRSAACSSTALADFAPMKSARQRDDATGPARQRTRCDHLSRRSRPGPRTRRSRVWSPSAARRAERPDESGLLPCRVHAFFRGLPGLWACLDPDCPEVDAAHQPGMDRSASCMRSRGRPATAVRVCSSTSPAVTADPPTRAPTPTMCLSRRSCGTSKAAPFSQSRGPSRSCSRSTSCSKSRRHGDVEIADLDLVTGRLNPPKLGDRNRTVFLPRLRSGESVTTDDEDEDGKSEANGEFKPCGVCGQLAGYGRSSVQDHQTKGDQPFQALVTRQIEVQPPSRRLLGLRAAPRTQGARLLRLAPGRSTARTQPPELFDAGRHPPADPAWLDRTAQACR